MILGWQKARITNCVTQEWVEVQFNPEEYTLSRSINYAQAGVVGLRGPLLQFVNGDMQTLEMELFLDTYEAHRDVRDLSGMILSLMDIDPSIHAPPPLVFSWGSLSFTCVLTKVTQRFVLFLPSGIPVRARLQVSFSEFINPQLEAREIKRETADYSRSHLVMQGESLSAIAATELGDPALWRVIALDNALDDPRSLRVGERLSIPRLPYTDPETGEVMR
ncbi:CIS tube protein [Thiococcus pfennigii]|uniref:CIS tube protein n=1 Tax=Thiococcus pfennigii TaxID=1057 RepID=UPI001F5BF34B|nr:peptigoglycan-binding protein LysM [Thiococcus pfennigii]